MVTRYGSHGWYAQRVLSLTARVRAARDAGRIDEALWAAALIGHAIAESSAKGWRDLMLGQTVRQKNRNAATRRGQDIRQRATVLDRSITQLARIYRAKHPYTREHSTRAIAAYIAQKIKRPASTIRVRLRVLGIR